jgi:hypothetical protein
MHPNVFNNWFFGTTNKTDEHLLAEILHDTNPIFLKWAIDKIVYWKNKTIPKNSYHIHGTADRILPIRNIDCDAKVIGGGHFMTVYKAEEINLLLKMILA